MSPFGSHTDLAERWRPLTTAEQTRANVQLGMASRIIRRFFPDVDVRLQAQTLDRDLVVDVVCGMVRRAFEAAESRARMKTGKVTVGQVHVEPILVELKDDDVYLTDQDRQMLAAATVVGSGGGVVPRGLFPPVIPWPR